MIISNHPMAVQAAAQETMKPEGSFEKNQNEASQAFKSLLTEGLDALKQGEVAAAQATSPTTDILSTLTATHNAEASLNTIVAFRDRIVQGVQEVFRMAI